MKYLIPLALLLTGCTTYSHTEQFSAGELTEWNTTVRRPWGTSDVEWKTTMSSETGAIRGEGISDNMRAVVGDDFGIKLTDSVICGVAPTSCIMNDAGDEIFRGSAEDRAAAEELLMEMIREN